MEEIREKLICALKSNAGEIENTPYYYKFKGIKFDANLVSVEEKVNKKYFWQESTKTILKMLYTIHFIGETYEITEEEFTEILNLRKEKIKERQIKELTELCK